MCCQPLPPSLSSSSAKLMIMALEEYGDEGFGDERRGFMMFDLDDFVKIFDDVMVNWIESYELMIDLQSIRDPESINF
ncbi:hypothetical protein Tco_1247434 [Tanacetum coccineum]